MVTPRGIRNNNPLNIRKGALWVGLSKNQTDDTFCQFISIEYGFRAAFRILRTYYVSHGLRTLYSIINRWAPFSENNTSQYVSSVLSIYAQYRGMCIDPYIELPHPAKDKQTWCYIVRCMMAIECGRTWADGPQVLGQIVKGWEQAFSGRFENLSN